MTLNLKKHLPFIGVIVFVVGVVGYLIWSKERIVSGGTEVILETRPIDPRDLFRGEYVILRYKIENDKKIKGALSDGSSSGDPVYVLSLIHISEPTRPY